MAVLSTVPTGYAAWDGTSMACPFISGLAALVLEAYPGIRTGDAAQPAQVRHILAANATDLGLPPELQGAGLANAGLALRAARLQRSETEAAIARYREYLGSVLARAKSGVGAAVEQSLADLQAR